MIRPAIARRDMTPTDGVPLFGYGDRTHDSTGVQDPLSLYAWWIEPGGAAPAAWVVLDLCMLGLRAAEELARAAVSRAALPGLLPEAGMDWQLRNPGRIALDSGKLVLTGMTS